MFSRLLLLLFAFGALNQQSESLSELCKQHQFVILLDAPVPQISFTEDQFNDQKNLIKTLITAPYFNDVSSLALGSYNRYVHLTKFNDFLRPADALNYLNDTRQSNHFNSYPWSGLREFIALKNKFYGGKDLTLVLFVSDLEKANLWRTMLAVTSLQRNGVRVVLVGHGNFANKQRLSVERLTKVTNDPKTVFVWEDHKSLPADDLEQWFNQVFGCEEVETSTSV